MFKNIGRLLDGRGYTNFFLSEFPLSSEYLWYLGKNRKLLVYNLLVQSLISRNVCDAAFNLTLHYRLDDNSRRDVFQ